jgi:hypothetical protein
MAAAHPEARGAFFNSYYALVWRTSDVARHRGRAGRRVRSVRLAFLSSPMHPSGCHQSSRSVWLGHYGGDYRPTALHRVRTAGLRISKCFAALVWPSASNSHPYSVRAQQAICGRDLVDLAHPQAHTDRTESVRAFRHP